MAIPTADGPLAAWSTNADTRLNATPLDFDVTAAIATAYSAVHDPYIAALAAVDTVGARSKALVADKNAKKAALLKFARELYLKIQASSNVTATNKTLLNVVIRKTEPTPQPRPAFPPKLVIEKVDGGLVSVRLKDSQNLDRRGRAPGTDGACVFSFVGETPPADINDWKSQGVTGEVKVDVLFEGLTPGTTVFLTAYWFNERKESSPAANPVSAVINYPSSIPTVA